MSSDLVIGLFSIGVLVAVLLITIAVLRRVLWWIAQPLLFIEALIWFAFNPFRSFLKNRRGHANRAVFFVLGYLLIKQVYQLLVWCLTLPIRFILALYFDVILYLAVAMGDSIEELLMPALGQMRRRRGLDYLWRWIAFFPYRLVRLVLTNLLAVFDAILMLGVGTLLPTFTLFHGSGTDAVFDISKKGRWYVGRGNYAGSGVYFGRSKRVAEYYARASAGGRDKSIILARVTLTMVRNVATLRDQKRDNVGLARGDELARQVGFPYASTELWREDHKWWEYCVLRPNQEGKFVSSWRIRPIGMLNQDTDGKGTQGRLGRLWGGKSHYCLSVGGVVAGIGSWLLILLSVGWLSGV